MAAPPPSAMMNSTRLATATVAPSPWSRPLATMKTASRSAGGDGHRGEPAIHDSTGAMRAIGASGSTARATHHVAAATNTQAGT